MSGVFCNRDREDIAQGIKVSAMKEFWTDTRAVTPTEYALLAAFVSLMMAGVLAVTGKNLSGAVTRIVAAFGDGTEASKNVPTY